MTVSDTTTHLDALAGLAHGAGGWGYVPDQPAHLEPTVVALLALAHERTNYQAAIDGGRRALQQAAVADGTYRLARGRDQAVWPTALALFAQLVLDGPSDATNRTASAMLALKGRTTDTKEEEEGDIDTALVGWPWADGNFSWVEPTAWACLALTRAGQGEHPRVAEGLRLLLDRTFDHGGINYGNRRIFGIDLEPIPTPTALSLLALQEHKDHPRVRASVAYLCQQADSGDDLEHLCWTRIALDLYRELEGVPAALDRLGARIRIVHEARAATPYVQPAPLRQALTALALSLNEGNPFRQASPIPCSAELSPGVIAMRAPSIGERVHGFFEKLIVAAGTALRQIDPRSAVHIAPVTDYNADLADVVGRQYDNFRERVPLKGKRVVLKPNLVEYHRDKVINTNPHVVAAVIELCRREGAAEVIVAEGPGHWRNVEYLVAASGLGDVLRHYKVPFVDLNHDEPVKRVNLGRLTGLQHLFLSQTVATADVVISLPKLKTHHWAVATLSLKNLFGTLPGICYGWPKNELHWRGIDNSIVDIAATRMPDLAVVDGIIGMEGDGPLNGTPKPMGVLVMGCDLVALDATCCRLMQLDAERIGYLSMAHRKKLGQLEAAKIQQLGETIEGRKKPFETVPHFKELWVGRTA
jgi:uncharacterized protein (DUF362 family)